MPQNYCIISPDTDPESSTFIKVLRDKLAGEKDYLYDGLIPSRSLQNGYIRKPSLWDRLYLRINKTNTAEYFFEKYLRKQKIQLVFAQYGPTGASVVDICKRNNIKLITHFHGFDAYETKIVEQFDDGYKKVFNYATGIIAVSKDMIEQLVKLGADRDKITYTPCAPNNAFFDIVPDYTTNNFLFTGRFVDKKAPYLVILAFEKVLRKHSEMKLTMVGDGPLLNTCINLAKHLRIDKYIQFTGKQSHAEVIAHYSKAFCYVQHSVRALNGDSEGTPVSILEANAASLPVVATRHAGIIDTQIENETAFLVDEFDVDTMAEKMIKLAENRQIAEEMGKAGGKRVEEHYRQELHLSTINTLIGKII